MSFETDLLLDRRRLKRRLFFWRVLAVFAVLGAGAATFNFGRSGDEGEAHVARLSITGVIADSRRLTERIARLARNDNVKAIVLAIDSPGGTVSGGESLYRALSIVAEAKPVVVVMRGVAASAGYMIAMPAARIYARDATITGSIGVIMQMTEISGLMRTLGITGETIASGPLKDQPNLLKPISPEGRAVLQGMVADMQDLFVEMVARGRKMEFATVRQLADGRAYTGRQALKLGLIDAIGGETEARAWLAEAKQISATLPIRDVVIQTWSERVLEPEGETMWGGIWKALTSQRVMLDGAWAIWQPGRE